MQSDTICNKSYYFSEHFKNNVSKACILMVFETIRNCREIIENNVSKVCILVVSETIWNCRKIWKECTSKACILTYLKRFRTSEKRLKTMYLKHALLRYLKWFGTVGKDENKDAYACNTTSFYTICWLAEIILKAMKLNGSFWRFLRLMLDDF